MKNIYFDKRLKELFQQLPDEKPSNDFSAVMMQKIHREALRKNRREVRIQCVWIITATFSLLGLAYYALKSIDFTFQLPDFSLEIPAFSLHIPQPHIPTIFICIGFCALLLLGLDYLMRRLYFKHKRNN